MASLNAGKRPVTRRFGKSTGSTPKPVSRPCSMARSALVARRSMRQQPVHRGFQVRHLSFVGAQHATRGQPAHLQERTHEVRQAAGALLVRVLQEVEAGVRRNAAQDVVAGEEHP